MKDLFDHVIPGFSPGILDHPKIYLTPEKTYSIVPKADQERLLRFAAEEPLPEHVSKVFRLPIVPSKPVAPTKCNCTPATCGCKQRKEKSK